VAAQATPLPPASPALGLVCLVGQPEEPPAPLLLVVLAPLRARLERARPPLLVASLLPSRLLLLLARG
jgi:hypothetical protein